MDQRVPTNCRASAQPALFLSNRLQGEGNRLPLSDFYSTRKSLSDSTRRPCALSITYHENGRQGEEVEELAPTGSSCYVPKGRKCFTICNNFPQHGVPSSTCSRKFLQYPMPLPNASRHPLLFHFQTTVTSLREFAFRIPSRLLSFMHDIFGRSLQIGSCNVGGLNTE